MSREEVDGKRFRRGRKNFLRVRVTGSGGPESSR